MFPTDGCGLGIDPDCTVPTNVTLTFRFDRFLDPSRVADAVWVYSGDRRFGLPFALQPFYDPVERVVEFRVPPGRAYRPTTLYQVELLLPETPEAVGIRAFDGATLAGDAPLRFSFFTGTEPVDVTPRPETPTCDEVVDQVFGALGNCAGQECHRRDGNALLGSNTPLGDAPHQLWLDQRSSFALSAIGRVARQTELGDISGGPSTPRALRFGVRMALVEPSNPGASYLMYKLLLGPNNFESCPPDAPESLCAGAVDPPVSSHQFLPLAEGEPLAPPPAELERLREWFVQGEPMPRDNSRGTRGNVRIEGLRAVSSFIAAGASCDQ
jgi:hypothetical protein